MIWLLEQGAALRANNQIKESIYAFERAEKRMRHYDSQAKIRVSKEATALAVNLESVPYEGRGYDRVMLNTYQALNYLHLGQRDAAMVELRQASDEQDAELIRNARRITSARKSAGRYRSNILRTQNRAGTRNQFDSLQPSLNMDYGAFVNPFTDFLHALCLWSLADDQSENAIVSLRRIYQTLGQPRFIADEIKAVDKILSGGKHPDLTYVIFEIGVAPIRKEVRLDIPLFDQELPYVTAEFPRLENRGHPLTCTVVIGKNKIDAMVICEMDAVIGRDFQSELPGIITRTLSSAVLKATATKQLSDKAGDIGTVAGTMYQIFSTQADLRTWTSLPKSFAVARIKTPSDRRLTLFVGPQKNEVTVNKGEVNVVYLKGFAHGAPLKIHQFRLK
ncbi:MAG: hypothetical protein VX704_08425 [Verrucomicrobiota bacterium]|nr:hypothetical protein [Verrucomicrobiota bacterium]